ncbi:hypothetical protein BH23GEM9_BH23GEM9_08730 [soil metagenome]
MHRFVLLPATFALLLAAACVTRAEDPTNGSAHASPEADTHMRTGSAAYDLVRRDGGNATSLDFSFTNPLDETIYVVNCRGGLAVALERWSGQAWERAWTPVLLQCLSPPIEIAAGETFRSTVDVWGSDPGRDHLPEFTVSPVEGSYRLVWDNLVLRWRGDYVDGAFGDAVPLEFRVSNSFELRRR